MNRDDDGRMPPAPGPLGVGHQQAGVDRQQAEVDHRQAVLDHEQAAADHQKHDQAAKKQEEERKKKQEEKEKEAAKPRPKWPWIVGGLVVVAFVLAVLYIILAPHSRQETDDAYVSGHYAVIAPRVEGQVAGIYVDDNQSVHAGDLLLQLDDRDQRASLLQAEAAFDSDRARVAEADAQVARQPALILQSRAQVVSARARLELSTSNSRRYGNLAGTGAGTVQQRQQADVALRQDQASLASAEAELVAAQRQLESLRAERDATKARVDADEAQVTQGRLNLSYTRIMAPLDGAVDQRSIQVGNFVTPGTAVMTIVPLDSLYVLANYRELALRHMRPGQHVVIHVDAYDIDLDGVVESLPASSGAAYSPIPPNNATGNFTKIVQRFPVKIAFAQGQRLARLARIGMSVETAVYTNLDDVVDAQRREDGRVTQRPWRSQ